MVVIVLLAILALNPIPPLFFGSFEQYAVYFTVFLTAPVFLLIEPKYVRFLGDLSYPIYISHEFACNLINCFLSPYWTPNALAIADVVFALFIAILLKRYVSDLLSNIVLLGSQIKT